MIDLPIFMGENIALSNNFTPGDLLRRVLTLLRYMSCSLTYNFCASLYRPL